MKAGYGYSDFNEYRNKESSGNHVHRVNVPLLVVNAKDDPLFSPELLQNIRATVS